MLDPAAVLLLSKPPAGSGGVSAAAACVAPCALGLEGCAGVGRLHVACRSLLNDASPITSTVMAAATASMSCTAEGPAADRVSMRRWATAVIWGKHNLQHTITA